MRTKAWTDTPDLLCRFLLNFWGGVRTPARKGKMEMVGFRSVVKGHTISGPLTG
jgi:hypothetical protein